jgi:hypothetical protein
MEGYETLLATLALTMGASWASGINLYAALLVLGLGGSTGNIDLPPDLQVLQDPLVIAAAGVMYFVEFFIDKTPGVDTGWDTIHTFIRIPAGAMLAAGAVGDVTPALEIAAGIMGGTMSATSHFTKAGSRALINTSPEPFSNWGASITEDILVLGGLWAALSHPLVFLCLLAVFMIFAIWLLPKIWALLRKVGAKIGQLLGLAEDKSDDLSVVDSVNSKSDQELDDAQLATQFGSLKRLRDEGVLTEDEFVSAKQKLLAE